MSFFQQDVFWSSFRDQMTELSERPIGYAELPELTPNLPYAVFYPIGGSVPEFDMGDPESMIEQVVQFTCVGKVPKQASWMSARIAKVLIGRTNGKVTYPLADLEGGVLCWRRIQETGMVVKSGDQLFNSMDTYRLRIQPNGDADA